MDVTADQVSRGEQLKRQLRELRDDLPNAHATRLHRAVSWLRCAEKYSEDDPDMSFIALWIALNSCYAADTEDDHTFWQDFSAFAKRLVQLDDAKQIYNLFWFNYSGFIRLLVDNHWVYEPFWQSIRQGGNDDWQAPFERSKKAAMRALANDDVTHVLDIVMNRLYTLRNQLVHGGATWQGQANRDQVQDGQRLMMELVPAVIEIMMNNDQDWGEVFYPYIKE